MPPNEDSSALAPTTSPSDDRIVRTVAVLYAMQAEAGPLVEHLKLQENKSVQFPAGAPWKVYSGDADAVKVHVVTPGKCELHGVDNVGTVPASVLAYAIIEKLQPDLLINAGTAGGFQTRGAAIGDVYCVTEFANHDRRIPLPGFDSYGIGAHKAWNAPGLAKSLGLKFGKASTGNSLDATLKDLELIHTNEAVVKDMESAGVAWVARMLSVPLLGIKAVTDIVDGDRPTTEEFLENLHTAAEALQRTVPKVLQFACGKKLTEL